MYTSSIVLLCEAKKHETMFTDLYSVLNFWANSNALGKKTGRDRFEINIFLSGALFVFNSAREKEISVVLGKTDSIKTIFKKFSRGY